MCRVTCGPAADTSSYVCGNLQDSNTLGVITYTCTIGAGIGSNLIFALNFNVVPNVVVGSDTLSYPGLLFTVVPGTLRKAVSICGVVCVCVCVCVCACVRGLQKRKIWNWET
jgi:hypothetical protein